MIVLTRPPTFSSRAAARRRIVGAAEDVRARWHRQPEVRGPLAVLSSLSRGLKALSLPFELNPHRLRAAQTVAVLSDIEALEQAIAWRRQAEGRRLLAGPNLVVLPSDAAQLMTAPEIDVCIVPCKWVKRLYEEDAPELVGRIAVWPAGVDVSRWEPDDGHPSEGRKALIYRKSLAGQRNTSDAEIGAAARALERRGFAVTVLTYGTFDHDGYRRALGDANLLVFFSPSESQCLAQVEAWAMNVPTFIWPYGRFEYRGRTCLSSSSPYLSSQTGLEFVDMAALERLLDRWNELRATFTPRRWVLDHMTDEISARAFWDIAHGASAGPLANRRSASRAALRCSIST